MVEPTDVTSAMQKVVRRAELQVCENPVDGQTMHVSRKIQRYDPKVVETPLSKSND